MRAEEQIRKAVLAVLVAVLSEEVPDVRVGWESMSVVPLEGKPAVGRCAVCNRWVYDLENATELPPTRIKRGPSWPGGIGATSTCRRRARCASAAGTAGRSRTP
ncbi:hypothetical protein R5W24_000007 [Gemmata sp. JC717]|uniref:hypothetical protein n=1 Tax=Gemmata algarum TaxID=2975278 RepID=UPI0021BAD576|nr:hypothetical protein [Gemmata algarum]MDY3550938.1 hypothetical protein [Gemmata algarum]